MPGVDLDIWNEPLSSDVPTPSSSRRNDAYTQPIGSQNGSMKAPPSSMRSTEPYMSRASAPAQSQQPPPHYGFAPPPPPPPQYGVAPGPPPHGFAPGPPPHGFAPGPPPPSSAGAQVHFAPQAFLPMSHREPMALALDGASAPGSHAYKSDVWKQNNIWIILGIVFVIILLLIIVFQLSRLNKILSKKF